MGIIILINVINFKFKQKHLNKLKISLKLYNEFVVFLQRIFYMDLVDEKKMMDMNLKEIKLKNWKININLVDETVMNHLDLKNLKLKNLKLNDKLDK